MTKDLRWTLPFDEQVEVNRHIGDDGRAFFVVDHFCGDGGSQSEPFSTRRAARAAALIAVEQIYKDWGR